MTQAAAVAPLFDVELAPGPYPGLRPFQRHEWPIFFGRENMTGDAIRRLLDQNLLVVHGDSGCGKSSLIRAGVLVQLEQRHARGGQRWRTCDMLPREAPLKRMAEALAKLKEPQPSPDLVRQIRRALNAGRGAAAILEELLCSDPTDRVCILVDQFEELFRFASDTSLDEARLFVDVLIGVLDEAEKPRGAAADRLRLYAVLTMRSEFLGHCARYEHFAETVNRTQYLLPRMERRALLRAIRNPAPLYDGEVDRALAERIITDAEGGQDQLPLMQHGLMLLSRAKVQAWKRTGKAWHLHLEDYVGAGGLAELLSKHADDVMATASPDPARQKIVEHLFRALTDINAEGYAIRRPQTFAQLQAVTGADEAKLRGIIDTFRAEGISFLTPYGDAPIQPETQIDISHEALIRCWARIADRVHGWLHREFQDGLLWTSLQIQANQGEILSAAATTSREQWLDALPSVAWTERYADGWEKVQDLMRRSSEAREEEERRQRRFEEAMSRAEDQLVQQLVSANEARSSELERALAQGQREREALSAAVAALSDRAEQPDASPEIARALKLLREGVTTQAEEIFGQIVQQNSPDRTTAAEAARHLGALAFLDDIRKATGAYETATRLDPDDGSSWILLGRLYQRAGNLARAGQAYANARAAAERAASEGDIALADEGLGEVRMAQGDLVGALSAYESSLAIRQGLVSRDHTTSQWQRDLSVSHNKIGDVRVAQGKLSSALESYHEGLAIAEHLAAQDPSNAGWQRDLAVAQSKVGDVRVAQGKLSSALESYHEGLAIAEHLAAQDPSNADWQRELAVTQSNVGNVLQAQGQLQAAQAAYAETLAIFRRLVEQDPSNAGWQWELAVAQSKVGNVLQAQGQLQEAQAAYVETLAIARRLVEQDPSNAGWQRDLAVAQSKVGDVRVAQGKLSSALESYHEGLAIAEHLAAQDPSNAAWQRELAVAQSKVGNVLQAQGQLQEAQAAYAETLAISRRLFEQDPSNAGWQWELAVAQSKVGNVLQAQGQLQEAQAAYVETLAISRRLVEQDPSNADWQRELAVTQSNVGNVLQAQGQLQAAQAAYAETLAISRRLVEEDPSNAGWQRDLAVAQSKVGDVLQAQGQLQEAQAAYAEYLAISRRLVEQDPSNAGWQWELAVAQSKVGNVLQAQGQLQEAQAAYAETLAIFRRLVEQDPSNAGWQRELAVAQIEVGFLEELMKQAPSNAQEESD